WPTTRKAANEAAPPCPATGNRDGGRGAIAPGDAVVAPLRADSNLASAARTRSRCSASTSSPPDRLSTSGEGEAADTLSAAALIEGVGSPSPRAERGSGGEAFDNIITR